jgi:hypothetical protein
MFTQLELRKNFKGQDLVPSTELRLFIHKTWMKEAKAQAIAVTPPSRPSFESRGQPLAKSWHTKTPGMNSQKTNPWASMTTELYNDKEVQHDGKKWNLLSILHNGSGPYTAKRPDGWMKFYSRGEQWYVQKVRGINPLKIARYGTYDIRERELTYQKEWHDAHAVPSYYPPSGASYYSMRKDLDIAFRKANLKLDQELFNWRPKLQSMQWWIP